MVSVIVIDDTGSHVQLFNSLTFGERTLGFTVLARACLTVLLQLDRKTDKKTRAALLLAFYAARHWVHHAKYDGATPRVQGAMKRPFDTSEPYLAL